MSDTPSDIASACLIGLRISPEMADNFSCDDAEKLQDHEVRHLVRVVRRIQQMAAQPATSVGKVITLDVLEKLLNKQLLPGHATVNRALTNVYNAAKAYLADE